MNDFPLLYPGIFYHIYNRGNNRENIFVDKDNYRFFLDKYYQHTSSVVDTYAYCLLKNHFHLLVKVKEDISGERAKPFRSQPKPQVKQDLKGLEAAEIPEFVSQQFSNFFNSYSKAFNKRYKRSGSLFLKPFRRKIVANDSYFSQIIAYIHFNPVHHKFEKDFRDYAYSSYNEILFPDNTRIKKEAVLDWFGGKEGYIKFHQEYRDFTTVEKLIEED